MGTLKYLVQCFYKREGYLSSVWVELAAGCLRALDFFESITEPIAGALFSGCDFLLDVGLKLMRMIANSSWYIHMDFDVPC